MSIFWNFTNVLVGGTLARADDVNVSLSGIDTGFDLVEADINKAIMITTSPGVTDIVLNAAARANKLVAFDVNGDIAASQILGDWKGDHANAAGTDYQIRDVVSDAAGSVAVGNLYICTVTHTSTGGLSADIANWDLLLDVGDVPGNGDVSKVGTPVNNEIGVWTGDGTLEGDSNLRFILGDTLIVTGVAAAIQVGDTGGVGIIGTSASDAQLVITAHNANSGGTINLYGQLHSTKPRDIEFWANTAKVYGWDDAGNMHTLVGPTTITGALSLNAAVDIGTEILLTERADHVFAPVATRGILWVRSDAPNVLVYTDDAGTDWDLNTAAVSKVGTPVNNQIGVWTGDGTLEGDAALTWDGTILAFNAGPGWQEGANNSVMRLTSGNASAAALSFFGSGGVQWGQINTNATELTIWNPSEQEALTAQAGGATTLHHNSVERLATSAVGITVAGEVDATTGDFTGNVDIGTYILQAEAAAATDPGAGNGKWWVKSDAPTRPYFTDDTDVDRKIVTADPVVSGHIRAGNMQMADGEASNTQLDVDSALTIDTFETVGPTGSGADNIWATMDQLPDNATILMVQVVLNVNPNSGAQGVAGIWATHGDDATPGATTDSIRAAIVIDPDSTTGAYIFRYDIMIPLGATNQDFNLRYTVAGSAVESIALTYRGFLTD